MKREHHTVRVWIPGAWSLLAQGALIDHFFGLLMVLYWAAAWWVISLILRERV